MKVSRLVFPMGRVTLTIALPAVAYIRGPSPSPIHEESTLFPTGLRSPILSPLLPFFPLSFFLSFFLILPVAYREFDDRLTSGSHYARFQVQSKSNLTARAHPPTCQLPRQAIPVYSFVTVATPSRSFPRSFDRSTAFSINSLCTLCKEKQQRSSILPIEYQRVSLSSRAGMPFLQICTYIYAIALRVFQTCELRSLTTA